jgi:hypothetical protein
MRAARIVAILPALAGLAWASASAIDAGVAGAIVQESIAEMNVWAAMRRDPSVETWRSVRDGLLHAQALAPADPNVHELLGALYVRDPRRESSAEALVQFGRAIESRPTSPYSWANLATAKYGAGDTGREFEAALARAAALGPHEPEVQRTVAFLGLALWDEMRPATRAAVERMVRAGMSRNPLEMLQIAERRGRLDIACGHLAGSARRIGSKWAQTCQSLEATS